jgi:hypothetical protein
MSKSKCDGCGETVADIDAGFSPAVHGMRHDCGGTWRAVVALPDEITEADKATTSKAVALANLREQVSKREAHGVIDMYERAAWNAGATGAEDPEGTPERLYRGWRLDRY